MVGRKQEHDHLPMSNRFAQRRFQVMRALPGAVFVGFPYPCRASRFQSRRQSPEQGVPEHLALEGTVSVGRASSDRCFQERNTERRSARSAVSSRIYQKVPKWLSKSTTCRRGNETVPDQLPANSAHSVHTIPRSASGSRVIGIRERKR